MSNDIKILKKLLAYTVDSADKYTEAEKDARSSDLRIIFTNKAQARRIIAEEFRTSIVEFGSPDNVNGTFLADIDRSLMATKSLFASDDEALLAEIDRAETLLIKKFQNALNKGDLSPAAHFAVSRILSRIETDDPTITIKNHTEAPNDIQPLSGAIEPSPL